MWKVTYCFCEKATPLTIEKNRRLKYPTFFLLWFHIAKVSPCANLGRTVKIYELNFFATHFYTCTYLVSPAHILSLIYNYWHWHCHWHCHCHCHWLSFDIDIEFHWHIMRLSTIYFRNSCPWRGTSCPGPLMTLGTRTAARQGQANGYDRKSGRAAADMSLD